MNDDELDRYLFNEGTHRYLHRRFGAQPDATGRLRYHTREFNQAERAHPDYDRFRQWEKGPFTAILSRWDRGLV